MKTIVVFALLAAFAYAQNFTYFIRPLTMNKVGEVVFTPAVLPCSYTIKINSQQFKGSNRTAPVYINQRVAYDGGIVSLYSEFRESGTKGFDVIRSDLKHSEKGEYFTPLFSGYASNTTHSCSNKDLSESETKKDVEAILHMFTEKTNFDGVKDTLFQGKRCKMYYTEKEDLHIHMYVDNKNYIIGVWEQQGKDTLLAFFSYQFNAPMYNFALDREEFPGCDEKAYSAPQEQCH